VAAKALYKWFAFRGAFGTAFFNIVLAFQDASYFVEQRLRERRGRALDYESFLTDFCSRLARHVWGGFIRHKSGRACPPSFLFAVLVAYWRACPPSRLHDKLTGNNFRNISWEFTTIGASNLRQ
jgi:hypothetical protein